MLCELVAKADVLVENSRSGWLESLGLGPDDCRRIDPRLVIARASAFGQTGPYAPRASMDRQALAMSSVVALTGEADGPPVKPGVFLADYATAIHAAFLIMAAMRARDTLTGEGQVVDLGLYEVPFRMTADRLAEYRLTGTPRRREGNASKAVSPSNAYRCRDGVWVMIACSIDAQWQRFAELVGVPDADRAGLATTPQRLARRAEVERAMVAADLPISRVHDARIRALRERRVVA